tara:strand:+ start:456 stop:965 length:510 start_codon:yes stop_codon:yes gene_type:complete
MINEAEYWRKDIGNIARKLANRANQKKWFKRSEFAFEKEIFIAFFSIRKIIESKKISTYALSHIVELYEIPLPSDLRELVGKADILRLYDIKKSKKTSLKIEIVCNQFIHSYIFRPYRPSNKLLGIFVSSDRERQRCLYYISMGNIIDMLILVSTNPINKSQKLKTFNQ